MAGKVVAVDHVGYVVTNLEEAVRFFIDVLGFEECNRTGNLSDHTGDKMTSLFGVHPRADGNYHFLQIGGMKVELLQWTSPDQHTHLPKNSDLGGRHIAIAVEDIDDFLVQMQSQPGVSVRERNQLGFYYMSTPFGLEIQLIPAK